MRIVEKAVVVGETGRGAHNSRLSLTIYQRRKKSGVARAIHLAWLPGK